MLAPMSGSAFADVLDDALARFAALRNYQVTLRSSETPGGPFREVIRYAYRTPGWVRMDFVRPRQGMILIYDPEKQVVRLWPFGANGPDFSLSPQNWLLTSAGGHRVDRSDIGALLAHAAALRSKGTVELVGEEPLGGRLATHVRVTGAGDEVVDKIHRFDLWLDAESLMPLQAEGYGLRDVPVDLVRMDDLVLDVALPERLFDAP
jgi:outer membrane lipoprotein-sorting protein